VVPPASRSYPFQACSPRAVAVGGRSSSTVNDVLNFSNWPALHRLRREDEEASDARRVHRQDGIKVNYFEDINSNAEYFGKIQGPLSQGQRDRPRHHRPHRQRALPRPDDRQGLGRGLDKDKIPNISNLIDAQAARRSIPTARYSLPWQSGMTGIAWNEKVTGPSPRCTQLLEDPKLKGKVTALNGMGDTMGLVMLDNGDDPPKVTDATWNSASSASRRPSTRADPPFTGNDYAQPLAKGDLAAAVAWSGDIYHCSRQPEAQWELPTKGGMIWTDNMIIPTGGSAATASTYMNFVYDPKIAAQIAAYVAYVPPVKGTQEALGEDRSRAGEEPARLPVRRDAREAHQFDSAALNNETYIEQWQKVLGAVRQRRGVTLPPPSQRG
jgi:spermidine/putrescine transport system substrate-binding protein